MSRLDEALMHKILKSALLASVRIRKRLTRPLSESSDAR